VWGSAVFLDAEVTGADKVDADWLVVSEILAPKQRFLIAICMLRKLKSLCLPALFYDRRSLTGLSTSMALRAEWRRSSLTHQAP
jgi:hypothetical protein